MKWLSMIRDWQKRGLSYFAAGLTLIGGLFTMTGCGSHAENQSTGPVPADTDPPTSAAADAPGVAPNRKPSENIEQAAVMPSHNSTLGPTDAQSEFGAKWLEEQIRHAAALRSASKYDEEALHWDTVVLRLEKNIGSGNWLVAGARLSQRVARRLAQLNHEQRTLWKTFESLETKFLQNQGEIQELMALGKISPEQFRNATLEQLEMLKQQATIIEKLFGQPSHLLANVAYHQAEVLASVQQWRPAFIAAERCLVQRQALIQVRHPDTVAALKLMGQIAQQMDEFLVAEDCFLKAVQSAEHVWGTENAAYAVHANDLGVYYYTIENQKAATLSKDFSKANHWLERGLKIRQKVLGPDHLLVAMSCRNYALSKMAEAMQKPSDRQALDLAVANTHIERALRGIRSAQQNPNELLLQVLSEAATIKILIHEYAEADTCLAEIVAAWKQDPQQTKLPVSLATLHYRWGLACAKQRTAPKLDQAARLMEQAIGFGQGFETEAKTLASARQALNRLNEIATGEATDVIADREAGSQDQRQGTQVAEQQDAAPVRIVALPNVD